MKQHLRPNGVLTLPDSVALSETQATPRRSRARGGRLPTGPIPVEPSVPSEGAEDPIVRAMLEQDVALVDAFSLDRTAAPARRGPPEPTRGAWNVAADEDAVVLLERDGVYSWRYGDEVAPAKPAAARRGTAAVYGTRTIEFDLGSDDTTRASGPRATRARRSRNPLADAVVGNVRGWVFRFVARFAAETVVAALERKQRIGLVWMQGGDPLQWRPINALRDVLLPLDRTPRILLFVHGTFSSTLGSFGHLGATSWGQAFLADAAARYDAIIGFDHRTLADDPLQNATQLLDRIEDSSLMALDVDAISFSRGGLVLRSLIEYLLPGARLRMRVRRAVFVAATNSGTELAAPKNWKRLIDLSTNLVAAGSRAIAFFVPPAALASTIVNHAIGSMGAFVKAVATVALEERHVPGLAAMMPTGSFVEEINKTQPGQPTAAESIYYAITSDFDVEGVTGGNRELPAGLVAWLADVVVDAHMRGVPNDLVVNNESTTAIDPGAGVFIKEHKHFDKNPNIYHTIFFTRKEVTDSIARWLEFSPAVNTVARAPLPPGSSAHFALVETTIPFAMAIAMIERKTPDYVVARRVDGTNVFHYAFRPEELLNVATKYMTVDVSSPIEQALEGTPLQLGEDSSSDEERGGQRRGLYGSRGSTTERTVLLDGTAIIGVIDSAGPTRSTAEMAARQAIQLAAVAKHASVPRMTTRSVPREGWTQAKPPMAGAPAGQSTPAPPITIFASADTSDAIPLGTIVPLNVLVSRDKIVVTAGPSRAVGHTTVAPDRPVIVQVVPKRNLEVVGDARAEVDPAQSESRLIFDLKGAAVGAGEVWIMLRQGAQVLLTLVLKPAVVAKSKKPSTSIARDAGAAQEAPTDAREYPVLQIFENQIGHSVRYEFHLQMSAVGYLSDSSQPLRLSQSDYVADIYQTIESYWTSKPGDVEAFTTQLRVFGGTLFDALVPAAIQHALWDARDTLVAIQVLAEEPFIPWELVHLKEPAIAGRPAPALPKESHFLGQKGLVRWLHNHGPIPRNVRVREGRSRYVVPVYPGDFALPDAQAEIPYLVTAFGSAPVTPIDAPTIQALLMEPGIDHFHFSGHGEADAKKAALDAHLLLSLDREGAQQVPRYLSAGVIGQTASLIGTDGNRPLVVLNACQVGRAGWHLTSIGGFAASFIGRGAAIFVGSLWSVGDEAARTFSEAFYRSLLDDRKSLAEAATAGREAARADGDATWMAYVVYGYPFATVTRE